MSSFARQLIIPIFRRFSGSNNYPLFPKEEQTYILCNGHYHARQIINRTLQIVDQLPRYFSRLF